MDEFSSARMAMIDSQLRSSGVSDRRILNAIATLPRERFVAPHRRTVAYVDDLQPLGHEGRFLLSPSHFARMAQLANVCETDRVLDVGASTGYTTAILSQVARDVVGLEFDADLVVQAVENLRKLVIENATVVHGRPDSVRDEIFDVVILEGAVDDRPDDLIALLGKNGRLVAPILRRGVAVVHVFVNTADGVISTSEFDATMPRLWNWTPEQQFVF
ncbi:hypothetical protein VW35_04625 [Devosia soli]|uniref:Protein-L-isoaspartate O-methyltransferase n=1 Tax=Devosia soli TaxID=361041 RepID=A0A0F5LDW0_9HYPH|nr:protein-L-isoaspartate O-methyltransferase [Devosia soli]KKB79792.1 hypothetical protein VW35_04625 [Devosia soli]